ncbi:hypothetical protein CEXT_125261 [Caerostris extrusa]|uniref:Uncharacterized protein n=1 Tax=Caerostris extrusa TaxID=172846 RepID=A0AAV4T8J7_CAEEX|nr:hypothetical protein CEXT_125261 [Caerostris extrusa]
MGRKKKNPPPVQSIIRCEKRIKRKKKKKREKGTIFPSFSQPSIALVNCPFTPIEGIVQDHVPKLLNICVPVTWAIDPFSLHIKLQFSSRSPWSYRLPWSIVPFTPIEGIVQDHVPELLNICVPVT